MKAYLMIFMSLNTRKIFYKKYDHYEHQGCPPLNRQRIQGFFDRCTGCRICELVCSSAKLDEYRPRYAAIQILIKNEGLACIPSTCVQCEDPHCMKNCIYNAIHRDEKLGIVRVKKENCTGCGMCIKACPIEGAIKLEPTSGKALKCDICDGDPSCVKFCPTEAIKLMKM
jgi:Fe-S-cluster-containing dehydrogenase component